MLSILLGLILLLGLSYAWLTLTLTGTKQNVIKVGNLSLILDDSMGDGIHVENTTPTYTETALGGDSYHFTVENNGTVDANYKIRLVTDDPDEVAGDFNCALRRDGKITNVWGNCTMDILEEGILSAHEKREYDLYIWFKALWNAEDGFDGYGFTSNIRLEATQQKEQKLSNNVMHVCDGVSDCDRVNQGFTYFQQAYYQQKRQYVWYSGRLWIVTGYDSNGNVKMVTTDPETILSWGTSSNYQGSHVETWMKEEFLPSLNNYENLLVTNQVWNYSKSTNGYTDPIENDALVTSPVGLLNSWDIYQGSNFDTYMDSTDLILNYVTASYLGNASSAGRIFVGGLSAYSYGSIEPNGRFFGVNPAVVLKNDVKIISGSGTQTDPYRLKGDTFGKKGDLLNTRYAGEYIAFGDNVNYSYRISKIENGLTKIVSTFATIGNDESDGTLGLLNYLRRDPATSKISYVYPYVKDSTIDRSKYLPSSTDYPAAYFFNHDFLNPMSGYLTKADISMIKTDQNWYPGSISGGESYKKLRTSSNAVVTTVGLLTLGELQNVLKRAEVPSNGIVNDSLMKAATILINTNSTSSYTDDGGTKSSGEQYRPSMYLKNNVKIKSGSGTKLDPYVLTME